MFEINACARFFGFFNINLQYLGHVCVLKVEIRINFYSYFHSKNKNSDGKRPRFSFRGRTLFRPFVAQVCAKWRLVKTLGRLGAFFEAKGRPKARQRRRRSRRGAPSERNCTFYLGKQHDGGFWSFRGFGALGGPL